MDDKNYFVCIPPDRDSNGTFTSKYTSKIGELEKNQVTPTKLSRYFHM